MKNERNLLKLITDDYCLNASEKTFENANIHRESAEDSSQKKHYGIAISHLILFTEELVKGLLLYMQHLGINVRNVSGIHLFFTDHIIRHRLATMLSLVYPMVKAFLGLVFELKEELHTSTDIKQILKETKESIPKSEKKIEHTFKNLDEMMDWWEKANYKKNRGFYVDYSNSLETPMQIPEKEYKQAYKIVIEFQNQIFELINYLKEKSKEEIEEIVKIQNPVINQILRQIIEARKKERKNERKIEKMDLGKLLSELKKKQ